MRFSELIKKWEDGWRGFAFDNCGYEWDFTGDCLDMLDNIDTITKVDEEWKIKEEPKKDSIVVNVTCNISNMEEIEAVVEKLKNELSNLKINFTLS